MCDGNIVKTPQTRSRHSITPEKHLQYGVLRTVNSLVFIYVIYAVNEIGSRPRETENTYNPGWG